MRPVRDISKEEDFRIVNGRCRVNSVEPEPVGTIVAYQFRIVGYDRDCDGSLMPRLVQVDKNGETTGWETDCVGMCPNTVVVLDSPGEMFGDGE